MSGHSKWSTIKRKKEKTDGARAKVFTKIGREIAVAVREGGPDPAGNSKLKDVIAKWMGHTTTKTTEKKTHGTCAFVYESIIRGIDNPQHTGRICRNH